LCEGLLGLHREHRAAAEYRSGSARDTTRAPFAQGRVAFRQGLNSPIRLRALPGAT
jgi:hypothetical protein